MYKNNTTTNKPQENKKQIQPETSNLFPTWSTKSLDIKKDSAVLKKKEYTSYTTIWSNSVYSFNKNYIKNIPSADNIVNKLIKSFFTINPLANNIRGKKSKLMQRKDKNMSLNRIFVSKSEIKHTNNKIIVTVYIFNKKKRSLLLKLSKLYNLLTMGFAHQGKPWNMKNNFEKLASKFIRLNTNLSKSNKLEHNHTYKPKTSMKEKVYSDLGFFDLSETAYNTKKRIEYSKKIINKIYGFIPVSPKIIPNINNVKGKYRKFKSKNRKFKKRNYATLNSYNNKISYYNRLNNLTKYNLNKFITYLNLSNTNNINNSFVESIHKLFIYTNQYKLYNNSKYLSKENITNLPSIRINRKQNMTKFNYSMIKLKSVNKLFALYNNITFEVKSNKTLNKTNVIHNYTKTLLLNTYKLLKKSYKSNTMSTNNSGLITNSNKNIKSRYSNKNIKGKYRKQLKYIKGRGRYRKQLKYINTKQIYNNVNILVKNLNRIDKFFNKYKNLLLNTTNNSTSFLSKDYLLSNQMVNNYKLDFINDILEKELLYINYLKQLSYNNLVFKNWFLFPLKALISKIYNQEIILNIVNLKYIHLNSDILSQGVDIRLKNFKKNKLVEVLKKAVKLVTISKVNIYACNEHSNTYKYINNYYNKFKYLNLDVFKELGFINNNVENKFNELNLLNNTILDNDNTPCTIRRLNHIQSSTINFIKFKSVFGARLEAAGRLTKRSTASRALFKFRYKGTLKNNSTINNSLSTTIIKNNQISNLQYTKISSKTRNGSFGLKGWINSN